MSQRETLVAAYQAGKLLEAVQAALSPDRHERAKLASELAALHNKGLVDVTVAFGALTKNSDSGLDFFVLRRVFETLLPELEAPMPKLSRCVLHLYREAAPMADGWSLLSGFQGYCAKDAERSQAALAEVEAEPEHLADLLVPILVAGSKFNSLDYIVETIRLSREGNLALRRGALFALGRLQGEQVTWANEDIARTLERAVAAETDEQALASAIKSAWSLASQDKPGTRLIALIEAALSKGGEIALRAASEIFGFGTPESSPELLDLLVQRLGAVDPSNTGTIYNIDRGLERLLRGEYIELGLCFLENLLRLELGEFNRAVAVIRDNPLLRSRVATRWLLGGDASLCKVLGAVFNAPMGYDLEIEGDAGELTAVEPVRFVFAARKAIGFLFLKPISATSFVLSLLRQAPDESVREELEGLLINPLLLNFSGQVKRYLERKAESEEDKEVKLVESRALERLNEYLRDLGSVGEIPALHPSVQRREAYRRFFSDNIAQSIKEARAESSILNLFPTAVLLYGRKAIHHAFGPSGEIRRMETALGRQAVEMEVPRMTILDPEGLEFICQVFRHERLET